MMSNLTLVAVDGEVYIAVDKHCWVPDWLGDSVSFPSDPGSARLIGVSFLRDLVNSGCCSGVYMIAVTYYDAKQVMHQHGDDIMSYLWEQFGEWPSADLASNGSWGGICCHYLSMAVEEWAAGLLNQAEIDC